MNEETIKALRGSIKKWKSIVAGTGKDEGVSNCPLCKLFFHKDCEGCPVKEKTGEECCIGSPYEEYDDAADEGIFEENVWNFRDATPEELTKLAQAELDFLISLLPKGEKA